VLLVASTLAVGYILFIGRDRVGAGITIFNATSTKGFINLGWRVVTCLVVTFPLIIGWLVVIKKIWHSQRAATIILTLGALASFLLATLLSIQGFQNEYKYIFTAAICLTPFPSLALEPALERSKKLAFPFLMIFTLFLIAPLAGKMKNGWPWLPVQGLSAPLPIVDLSSFNLKLDPADPRAALVNAIREQTPGETILVALEADLYLPSLTQRAYFVTPAERKPFPGVNISIDQMLVKVRGYDKNLIESRRQTLQELYSSTIPGEREAALQSIRTLKRPIGLIVDEQKNVPLVQWLSNNQLGRAVYQGDGIIFWLIDA